MSDLARRTYEAAGIVEDRNKPDFTLVRRGDVIEVAEAHDIGDRVKFLIGDATPALCEALFKDKVQIGQVGNVFVIISQYEDHADFIAFLGRQAKRLKFKLIVFISPLHPYQIERLESHGARTGKLRREH